MIDIVGGDAATVESERECNLMTHVTRKTNSPEGGEALFFESDPLALSYSYFSSDFLITWYESS